MCVLYNSTHTSAGNIQSLWRHPRATAAWLGTCQWSGFDLQLWSHIGGALWVNFWEHITISVQVISRFFGPYVSIKKNTLGQKYFLGSLFFVWQSQIGTLRIRTTEFGARTHIYIDWKYQRWLDYWWMNDLVIQNTWSLKIPDHKHKDYSNMICRPTHRICRKCMDMLCKTEPARPYI